MPWFKWSKTAANNSNADPSISWAAGMSPSSVEPSGRAMMAAGAQWRDDISGTITTGGTLNAYTVASNQIFDTLANMNGAMIAFVPHITNGTVVTLNVDGLGAKPLRSSPAVELGTGVLVQGTPYVVTYNNADAAFYLQNFFGNPFNIPVGGLMPYVGVTAPNANFVLPFGQAISRTTYAGLFALTASQFGGGDGINTFNVPDLRGRSVFGIDNMGGSTAGRITVAGGNFDGTIRTTGGAENHTLLATEMPSHTHTATVTDPGHGHLIGVFNGGAAAGNTSPQSNGNAPNTNTPGPQALSTTTGITVANSNSGSGIAHTILPPAMTLPYILRVI